jgi:hypothetical protein
MRMMSASPTPTWSESMVAGAFPHEMTHDGRLLILGGQVDPGGLHSAIVLARQLI